MGICETVRGNPIKVSFLLSIELMKPVNKINFNSIQMKAIGFFKSAINSGKSLKAMEYLNQNYLMLNFM